MPAIINDHAGNPHRFRLDYPHKTEFDALGRNGFVTCIGLEVAVIGADVHLEPVNSRGEISRCRIPVPLASLRELRDGLTALLDNPVVTIAEDIRKRADAQAEG